MDIKNVAKNLKEEMFHKKISPAEHSLLVNADIYLLLSEQRNYFFDKKNYFINEIQRLNELYQKNLGRKREWKKKLKEFEEETFDKIFQLENEVFQYKERERSVKVDAEIQTEIDKAKIFKLIKNNDSVQMYKNINGNRLTHFMERIKYGLSPEKPITKRSLLNLIADVFNEKIYEDAKFELEPVKKKNLTSFFMITCRANLKLKNW